MSKKYSLSNVNSTKCKDRVMKAKEKIMGYSYIPSGLIQLVT